jgi:hypothetical protein
MTKLTLFSFQQVYLAATWLSAWGISGGGLVACLIGRIAMAGQYAASSDPQCPSIPESIQKKHSNR